MGNPDLNDAALAHRDSIEELVTYWERDILPGLLTVETVEDQAVIQEVTNLQQRLRTTVAPELGAALGRVWPAMMRHHNSVARAGGVVGELSGGLKRESSGIYTVRQGEVVLASAEMASLARFHKAAKIGLGAATDDFLPQEGEEPDLGLLIEEFRLSAGNVAKSTGQMPLYRRLGDSSSSAMVDGIVDYLDRMTRLNKAAAGVDVRATELGFAERGVLLDKAAAHSVNQERLTPSQRAFLIAKTDKAVVGSRTDLVKLAARLGGRHYPMASKPLESLIPPIELMRELAKAGGGGPLRLVQEFERLRPKTDWGKLKT
ncbi:MAG: hypothetical protein AAB373_06750 [Patescibacteria group bacterium]